jgi:inorganic pyrophosphatase
MEKINFDPIGKLIELKHKAHPWHGIDIGEKAPEEVISFIEMVPTDTVKYEVHKPTGYLILDRPQKYSSILPALYGFIPQTYCGKRIGEKSATILKRPDIIGDGDPLDICVLTEKDIASGDILVRAIPIGGFRMIDGNEADDKIVAVLKNDALYGEIKDINELPKNVVDRLKHYFLSYKDMPDSHKQRTEITHIYGKQDALDVIKRSIYDYKDYIKKILFE